MEFLKDPKILLAIGGAVIIAAVVFFGGGVENSQDAVFNGDGNTQSTTVDNSRDIQVENAVNNSNSATAS